MKVENWSVAGQVLAWFLDVATICKEWFISRGVDPEIMEWVKQTKKGREALQGALHKLTGEYTRYIEVVVEWSGEATIPAQPKFVVKDHFNDEKGRPLFFRVDPRYDEYLAETEEATGEIRIVFGKLLLPSCNTDITPKLGSCPIMTHSQIYWLIQQQPKGEKPNGRNQLLLTGGERNFFRVVGGKGRQSRRDCDPMTDIAMAVSWYKKDGGRGWVISYSTTKENEGWEAGVKWTSACRIFTGKSAETSIVELV